MYDDTHRYFVQHLLSNSCILLEDAFKFYEKCNNKDGDVELDDLKVHIQEINKEIKLQGFKIVSTRCEVTCKSYIIFINTWSDEIDNLHKDYTPIQLEYFQSIVNHILSSNTKSIEPITAINLSSKLTSQFPRQSAESSLESWIDEGYFSSENSIIYLGPRYLTEYYTYLSASCKEYISNCSLCSEILVLGSRCKNCKKIYHRHCLRKFQNSRNICPECKKPWEEGNDSEADESDESNSDTEMDETN